MRTILFYHNKNLLRTTNLWLTYLCHWGIELIPYWTMRWNQSIHNDNSTLFLYNHRTFCIYDHCCTLLSLQRNYCNVSWLILVCTSFWFGVYTSMVLYIDIYIDYHIRLYCWGKLPKNIDNIISASTYLEKTQVWNFHWNHLTLTE